MVPSLALAANLPPPPEADRFVVLSAEQLAEHISKPAIKAVQEVIRERNCPQEGITGHSRPNPGSGVVVVTVACYPPRGLAESDERYYAYLEYPLAMVVLGDQVIEVDFRPYGFMYESGSISFITDMDGDYEPEFWLSGAVCECDGEPEDFGPEGCDCDGGVTVEFREGGFGLWDKGNGWNGQ